MHWWKVGMESVGKTAKSASRAATGEQNGIEQLALLGELGRHLVERVHYALHVWPPM